MGLTARRNQRLDEHRRRTERWARYSNDTANGHLVQMCLYMANTRQLSLAVPNLITLSRRPNWGEKKKRQQKCRYRTSSKLSSHRQRSCRVLDVWNHKCWLLIISTHLKSDSPWWIKFAPQHSTENVKLCTVVDVNFRNLNDQNERHIIHRPLSHARVRERTA